MMVLKRKDGTNPTNTVPQKKDADGLGFRDIVSKFLRNRES